MMNKKTAPVGVFDSGVGGLTVAREISRQLPDENIVYFGDTARVPYGSKSQNTIIRFSEQIIRDYYQVLTPDYPFSAGAAGEGNCDCLQYCKCIGTGCGER